MNDQDGLFVEDLIALDHFKDGEISTRVLVKSSAFRASLIRLAPAQEIDTHESLADACIQVLRGTGVLELPDRRIPLGPGMFASIPSHIRHSVKAETELAFLLWLSHSLARRMSIPAECGVPRGAES